MQLSVAVINAMLDAVEVTAGTAPYMQLFSGALPANCAAVESGVLLASGQLPSDWMNAASNGQKTMNGTWTLIGQAGAGSGTNATHYRLYASDGVTCFMQGLVSETGGGAEATLDNVNIATNQAVNVSSFTLGDTVNA